MYRGTFHGGPVAFFEDVSQNTFVVKSIIYTFQTLLGDGVMVGRDSHTNRLCSSTARYIAVMLCGDRSGSSSSLQCSGVVWQAGGN